MAVSEVVVLPSDGLFTSSDGMGFCSGVIGFFVLHAVAFSLDHDGFAVVHNAVEYHTGDGTVVVEDFRPFFEGAVGGDDYRSGLVSSGYYLEDQIGAELIDGQISEFIDYQ